MTARIVALLLLLGSVARAQEPDDEPSDEPPSEAAREPVYVEPAPVYVEPAQAIVAPVKKRRGRAVVALEVLPGYRRQLGSDWLGTSADLSFGGEAPNGFAALVRIGLFTGGSTFAVPFQHWSAAAVFVIPTGTRLRIDIGQTFGLFVLEQPHTQDGVAVSPSLGCFLAPTVDLWRKPGQRVYAEARLSYDWVPANHGDSDAFTAQLGLGVSF